MPDRDDTDYESELNKERRDLALIMLAIFSVAALAAAGARWVL